MPVVLRALSQLRRRLLIHRRGLAALCAAAAVLLGLIALRPPAQATVGLWTAARDLPTGTVLGAADLRRTPFAPGSVPRSVSEDLDTLLGRVVAIPLGAGEVLSPAKLVGEGLLGRRPGFAAVPLRIPDSAVVELLRVGDRIDVIATDPQGTRPAERLVADAEVLAVPAPDAGAHGPGLSGRLVLLAVPEKEVAHVADRGTSQFLTVTWNR